MTLDEKISQMMHTAAPIERLGIPAYNWWSEGLHGVASSGNATVFPQAIGLAATWDSALIGKMSDIISTEFRGKYNDYIKNDDHAIFHGLTVWSPNVNIFRDPRWGRGQETYGEDPYLAGCLGVAFIKGLQGNNPEYLKCVATPKHYAVHSGPEPLRHVFDAVVDDRDLMETYIPQFEMCIREGGAYSIMGAYNRYLGKPCCASEKLLEEILRVKWGFKGYVVSDCGAIDNIYKDHQYVKTPAEAAAVAVKAGCDLECGGTYSHLKEAVEKGLITEKEIDVCLKRLMTARMKLGMFDPEEKVPYNKLTLKDVDTKEHCDMALAVARKSMVLLKNDGILPLSKDIKSIAVLGPNAVREEILYGNYSGCSFHPVLPLDGLKNKLPGAEITYIQGCNYYDMTPVMQVLPEDIFHADGQQGIRKEIFDTTVITGNPVITTIDKNINNHWGFGGMKAPKEIKHYDYAVRWSGVITPKETSGYMFSLNGNYVMRLYINDKLVAEKADNTNLQNSSMIQLTAGENYTFRLEYECKKEWAAIQLMWGKENKLSLKESAALAAKSDAILMFAGISPSLEGEEMKVKVDGFDGGDRTSISLPKVQEDLLKELKATGKPVILILLNGSAMAVNFAQQNLNGILEAWYPGEEGGNAIADVLFGDYNPAGRLPVTFYKSEKDLPDFKDYKMKGRTYRYFGGTPLYPFGFGLSYTTFEYSNLVVPTSAKTGETVLVKVDVQNTGKMDGEEVAQLYVKINDAKYPVAIHSLQGFKRIHLKQGEKRTLEFILNPKQLSQVSDDFKRVELPGKISIFAGGCQPDLTGIKTGKILTGEMALTGDLFSIE